MPNTMNRTDTALRQLRGKLTQADLYGVVVPRFDPYQGEVVAPHDERLAFLTGFSGSAGIAAVTADHAVLFVDGRYQVQVRAEVDTRQFEIAHFFDFPIETWLEQKLPRGQRIGINPMLVPSALYAKLKAAMDRTGGELVLLETDLIDAIWPDQPPPPIAPIQAFPLRWAGRLARASAGVSGRGWNRPERISWSRLSRIILPGCSISGAVTSLIRRSPIRRPLLAATARWIGSWMSASCPMTAAASRLTGWRSGLLTG